MTTTLSAYLAILSALGVFPCATEPPLVVFDLSCTLRLNAKDPREVARAWDHAHAVATLQGNVNRTGPHLYIRFVERSGLNVDDYWLERMSVPGQWLSGRKRETVGSLVELVEKYRTAIKGAVVYDPRVAATSNLASTIAGVEDLIAIRYDQDPESLYHKLILNGPRLPVMRRLVNADGTSMFTGRGLVPHTSIPTTGSAKCDAYLWLKHHYIETGKVDVGYAGYYLDAYWMKNPTATRFDHHTLTNHDFFVAKRGWFFDLNAWEDEAPIDDPEQSPGTDLRTLQALLLAAYEGGGKNRMIHIGGFTPWAYKYTTHKGAGGKHEPVPTEWELVRIASAYNAFIDADAIDLGAMANASFYMHFPLRDRYPQRWVTREELAERGYLTPDGRVNFAGRDFVLFYVGDYDAASWVYQYMPIVWDHPDRGKIPLMWCISPVLDRRAPMALDHLRRTATPNDYFAAADNGAGYLNPGMLQEPRMVSGLPCGLDAWVRHCTPFYERWDISVTGFIIDGYAPGLNKQGLDGYANFSPNGIVPQKVPPTLLHGNMPVLRFDYDLSGSPGEAARVIRQRVRHRQVPFHWFRAILKTPDWYLGIVNELKATEPGIELLDGPSFFELYRIYLESNPDAAQGKICFPL